MSDKKKRVPIRYTSREFDTIKADLVDYARRYYPEVYKDFSEASFGSLMLDSVSYIGDVLSFYLDYQVNESYIDSAAQFSNALKLAKQFGYNYRTNPSSMGEVELYLVVPKLSTGSGIDSDYLPSIKKGSTFTSSTGTNFILLEDVDFTSPRANMVVATQDSATGQALSYAVKMSGRVISGRHVSENLTVGEFQRFKKLYLSNSNIAEIISVFDASGNQYYQVDFLSQDVVYKEVTNTGDNNDTIPMVLRPYSVPRRFTLETEGDLSFLQFGFGTEDGSSDLSPVEPGNVVLDLHGKGFISDLSFDPSKLIHSDKFGVSPSNTTLTVTYRVNNSEDVNVSAGELNKVRNAEFIFKSDTATSEASKSSVENSLEVFNTSPVNGDASNPTVEEIRVKARDMFATQNRAVTRKDFEALLYSMPAKFGRVKRCAVIRDDQSFKRNLNAYVLSEDSGGNLTPANSTLKENIKEWISQYKMVNDTIDILDGKVINIGIEFEIVADTDMNKFEVLTSCIETLTNKYSEPLYFGEPLYITEIYTTLNKIVGVVDTKFVKVVSKSGTNYADGFSLNISQITSADGRYIAAPKNAAFQIKIPSKDIKGAVV